jgi:hypothetical protein
VTETDPNNDVTPPCGDCGDCAMPCACDKPIETVAQLQRALEAAGVIDMHAYMMVPGWGVSLKGASGFVVASAATLPGAIDAAIDEWWETK